MMDSIRVTQTELLSDNWYTLKKVTYEYRKPDGSLSQLSREVYDRGNGATILLYNQEQRTVILTRQFRMPSYLNGNQTGFLVESCAGLVEEESPEECIMREAEEETGYRLTGLQKIFEAYSSPGAMTELLYYYIAPYNPSMKVNAGGGLAEEEENIELLEIHIDEAIRMIEEGEIRDSKTILLLQYVKLHGIL